MVNTIKVGYLISYDYEFVKTSLPRIYDAVPEIFFAVDSERKTWSGEDFTISDDFWAWVKAIDTDRKITIYEDKFYIPGLTPMECETRERNMLGKKMGSSDWYIQIDSDEYFVAFDKFIDKLKNYSSVEPVSIYCNVVTLFKQISSGYLLISESFETLSFATNNPVYDLARNNTSGNKHIHWQDLVLHQSWARSPEEIRLKLQNWGHKNDFNIESFYKLWDAVDEFNYYCLRDFHPLHPVTWVKLTFLKGTINEILNHPQLNEMVTIPINRKKGFLSRMWKKIKS